MADDFYKLYCEEVEKNEKLMKENKYLKGRVRSLSSQLDYLMENQDVGRHILLQKKCSLF